MKKQLVSFKYPIALSQHELLLQIKYLSCFLVTCSSGSYLVLLLGLVPLK